VDSRRITDRWRTAAATAAFAAMSLCGFAQEPPPGGSGPGFVLQGEGGLITALVLDPSSPSTLYAATGRGLYCSTDSGATWEPRNRGIETHSVLALAVDPNTRGTLYATTDSGVYKSTDGGAHWTAANHGLTAKYVGVVAVQGDAVYAGTEAGRIFRSHDAASTWTELIPPTTRVSITAIAVDPSAPAVIYAGTNSEGIFKSTDGGQTWIHTPGQLSKGTVWSLLIDPTKSSTVYATTHDGLFRTEDAGLTWKGLHKNLKSWNVLAIAVDPQAPKTLYAATAIGIYKSVDGGNVWSMQNPDLYVSALSLDPRSTSVVYAGTHLGVLKSTDAGVKWAPLRLAPDPNAVPAPGSGTAAAVPAASTLPKLPVSRRSAPAAQPGANPIQPGSLKPLPLGATVRPTPPAQRHASVGDE
jgi:photosystem II stability/assembly factor-like uncharacterized protein